MPGVDTREPSLGKTILIGGNDPHEDRNIFRRMIGGSFKHKHWRRDS